MEILEKIYLTVYLLSISIFLHYGNGGKIFFCKRIRIFFFKKIRREKASDIRKIHGSHKTIPMERKCQEVKEYGKKMFSCYGGGKYWTINLCRCRCWNYLKIRGIILDWT